MQTNSRFFDDIAKLATTAAGSVQGMKGEFEALVQQRLERILSGMDLVTRDEFDAVKEMVVKATDENEKLLARIDALEKAAKKPARVKAKPTE
jgi:BMFP domain-containing protein YqiC